MIRLFPVLFCFGILFIACQPDEKVSQNATDNVENNGGVAAKKKEKGKLNHNQLRPDPDEERQNAAANPVYARLTKGHENDRTVVKIVDNIKGMMGSNFLESVQLEGNTFTLTYFGNVDKYNEANKDYSRPLNALSLDKYWSTGSRGAKIMTSVPAEILKEFPSVETVKITLPTSQNTYYIKATREDIAEVSGFSWEEITADWSNKFTNPLVRLPEGRKQLLEKILYQ